MQRSDPAADNLLTRGVWRLKSAEDPALAGSTDTSLGSEKLQFQIIIDDN